MRSPTLKMLFLLVLAVLAAAGCQKRVATLPGAEARTGPEAYLRGAEEALEAHDPAEAIELYEGFLRAYPGHAMAEQAQLQLSSLYVEGRDYARALPLLRGWLERYPDSSQRSRAQLYLGVCLFYLDEPTESLNVLHPLAEDPAAAPLQPHVFAYLAEDYLKLKQLLPALSWYTRYEAAVQDAGQKRAVERKLVEIAAQDWDAAVLERALVLYPEGFTADAIRFGMAVSFHGSGQARLAEEILLKMSPRHLDDALTPRIQELLGRMYHRGTPQGCTIGCLLPLSGKYGRFGAGVLDALLLGARAFREPGEHGQPIRLLIRDTRGDPAAAVQQLKALCEDPDLVGIIGPLKADEAIACAREAQALGVPLIALTQKEEVAKAGDFVFQNGLTMRQQVEELVDYAMEDLGVLRFAVLYPNDGYGRLARDRFLAKVSAMGGEVVSSVPYGGQETDFQDEIRKLVGERYWQALRDGQARKGFKPTLEDDEDRDEAVAPESSGAAPAGAAELPFQALFIPDQYRKVALIAPHLALYDISGILLLGTNAWNSPHLVESAGDYVRGAVFVDGFFAGSPMPLVKDFMLEYRGSCGRDPGLLEAEALDSLWMLESAFERAASKTRAQVRVALSVMEAYPGLSGSTRFDAEGCAEKRLYLLSVMDGHIQPIE
ncbi:MAG: penicillin-binding protein activator [bacterium]